MLMCAHAMLKRVYINHNIQMFHSVQWWVIVWAPQLYSIVILFINVYSIINSLVEICLVIKFVAAHVRLLTSAFRKFSLSPFYSSLRLHILTYLLILFAKFEKKNRHTIKFA